MSDAITAPGRGAPQLVDAWIRELDAAGRAQSTLAGHRWHLTDTLAWLADTKGVARDELDLCTVSHEDLVRFLVYYRYAPDRRNTRNPEVAVLERSTYTMARRSVSLRYFFAWAYLLKHIPQDPADGLTIPRPHDHLPRAFAVPDAALLYDAAAFSRFPERDEAIAAVALGSGPRLGELAEMQLPHLIGRPPSHIRVRGKGGNERRIPLTPRAQAALDVYLPARAARLGRWQLASDYLWIPERLVPHRVAGPVRLSRDGIADLFDRRLKDAGIREPGKRVHVLRGTVATAMLRAGSSIRDVQVLFGHADIATTAKYLLVTDEELAAAVASSPLA